MFDNLQDRFSSIFTKLKSRGRLSQADVDETLREIRVALIEADVNIKVINSMLTSLREALVGIELSKSLSPGEQVIKAVNNGLIQLLGGTELKITYATKPPTVVLLAGLQGVGKTTVAAKLANWFKSQGRNPLLVGADLQRPAAVDQLRVLGEQLNVPVFSETTSPVEVAKKSILESIRLGKDVVIIDTAGRLAIDEELMDEVKAVSAATKPTYTFFVVDAMIGQDAVSTALAFNEALELDGIILTKVDGDARGGAALSVKGVIGKPIAFASTGEKISEFEIFYPDRMASRILGMGDVLTLIEQAEKAYDQDEAAKAADKLMSGTFNLNDFLDQFQQIKKMGSLSSIISMMGGLPPEVRNAKIEDKDISRVEAIIRSMTMEERINPAILNGSRRLRIARGAGVTTTEVNNLINQFNQAKKLAGAWGFGKLPFKKKSGSNKKIKGGRYTPKSSKR